MFEQFLEKYAVTSQESARKPDPSRFDRYPHLAEFFGQLSGATLDNGLYRGATDAEIPNLRRRIALAFPAYRSKVVPFAFDWLGRIWATTLSDDPAACRVYMFEAGVDAFAVPSSFGELHDNEFVDYPDEDLLRSLFNAWLAANGRSGLLYDECVGYDLPPVLGGELVLGNLSSIDLDVYWELSSQLAAQTQSLPQGTEISGFSITDEQE